MLVVLGASSEPTGDLHLFELLSETETETETGNEERELSDVAIRCDIGFVWLHVNAKKCVGSVGEAIAYQRNLAFYKFQRFEQHPFSQLSAMLFLTGRGHSI